MTAGITRYESIQKGDVSGILIFQVLSREAGNRGDDESQARQRAVAVHSLEEKLYNLSQENLQKRCD